MLVKGRMPHAFIPTLATLNAARGLALMLSDGAPQPGMPKIVQTAGQRASSGPIPVPILIVGASPRFAWVLANRSSGGAGSTSSAATRRRRAGSASRSTA